MAKIEILNEHIANQIAAGEVVERPASVVKELVENSIDAGSNRIEISIIEGGIHSILVKDNGEGIGRDDVDKAFLRHATSKIKSGKDLFHILTLGFRGEALPSIAAVSRIKLRTSTETSGHGLEIALEAGKIINKSEIAYPKGTEILVEDIFFNTPARLKYLKSLQTELGHITDYINRICLSYPHISFILKHNDRIIIRTSGDGQLRHVIAAIYGSEMAKNMIPIENESLDFKIAGYVAKPEITRANRNHISIYINGRYIKNFLLTNAIIKGYKTLLMVNRYPISVLQIMMDPSLFDVNVHPSKLEVRFSKEKELMTFIEESVYKTLNSQSFIREPIKSKANITYQREQQEAFDFTLKNKETQQNVKRDKQYNQQHIREEHKEIQRSNANTDYKEISMSNKKDVQHNEEDQAKNSHDDATTKKLPFLEPIAQLQGTYIVAQNEDGFFLIDQHAAHERINYEKNIALMNEELKISQELLMPITMDFTRDIIDKSIIKLSELREIGLDMELFGNQTLMIRSTPQWIPNGQEKYFIERIINMLVEDDRVDFEELRKDIIATTSCKTSIKANKYLKKEEMELLIEQLRKTNNPFSCPHGRPTIIHFSYYEIEKMFKRVV